MRRLQCALDVHADFRTLRTVQQHDVVPVVARQEQRLAHKALVRGRERDQRRPVERAEVVGEAAIYGAEARQKCRFLARRRGDGQTQAARGANAVLHEVRERPAAADVGCVCGGGRGDGGGVVDEVSDADVRVGCAWGEGEEDGEEGVLEEDGLPEFAALLLLEGGGGGAHDVRIAM